MESLWNDDEAARFEGPIDMRVYTSRLLGRDPSLVLHGGGNTSVKVREKDIFGKDVDVLYVKGSGTDLATIDRSGFSPVLLDHLKELSRLPRLSDTDMASELATHRTNTSAPAPSVEAILHAILPYRFVDHTHADSVLAVSDTVDGEARIREIYGDSVVVLPYVMPGFDLARLCAERFPAEAGPRTVGMVLLNHGIFSFGETARESYERMIALVTKAEDYLRRHKAWDLRFPVRPPQAPDATRRIAKLRQEISALTKAPVVVSRHADERMLSFAQREDVARLSQQGPVTPDHVIRTKRTPMLGTDLAGYKAEYEAYFQALEPKAAERKTMLDPAPRLVLDPELGLLAIGNSARDARIAADLYEHSIDVISRAQALGGYKALDPSHIFDVEYWDLEQAKLRKAGSRPEFQGEVVLVTGAASGIGRACVDAFLARGAAVVGLDINDAVTTAVKRPDYLGIACDLGDGAQIEAAIASAVNAFGGIDMAVLNAGIFPSSQPVGEMDMDTWTRTMRINVDANLLLMRGMLPYLQMAPRYGRVVVVGSKNVPAPGPGAAAYSASKAALTQLARVAALEWGPYNIRVNVLHPNAVFDTAIWSPETLAKRAEHYGQTVDAYKKSNVLRTEITSADVAALAVQVCGPAFARTTGAQIPIDGGNDRVI